MYRYGYFLSWLQFVLPCLRITLSTHLQYYHHGVYMGFEGSRRMPEQHGLRQLWDSPSVNLTMYFDGLNGPEVCYSVFTEELPHFCYYTYSILTEEVMTIFTILTSSNDASCLLCAICDANFAALPITGVHVGCWKPLHQSRS